jgi:hypothetical protein
MADGDVRGVKTVKAAEAYLLRSADALSAVDPLVATHAVGGVLRAEGVSGGTAMEGVGSAAENQHTVISTLATNSAQFDPINSARADLAATTHVFGDVLRSQGVSPACEVERIDGNCIAKPPSSKLKGRD